MRIVSDNNVNCQAKGGDVAPFAYEDFWATSYAEFGQQFADLRELMQLERRPGDAVAFCLASALSPPQGPRRLAVRFWIVRGPAARKSYQPADIGEYS